MAKKSCGNGGTICEWCFAVKPYPLAKFEQIFIEIEYNEQYRAHQRAHKHGKERGREKRLKKDIPKPNHQHQH